MGTKNERRDGDTFLCWKIKGLTKQQLGYNKENFYKGEHHGGLLIIQI